MQSNSHGAPVDSLDLHEFRQVSVEGFATRPPRADSYAISQILPRRVVTLLGGHGGAGKSIVAEVIVAHAACGREFAGFEPARALRCVFVSLEDASDIVLDRLRRIAEAYRLPADLIMQNLRIFDGTETDGALAFEVNEYGVRSLQFTPLMEQLEDIALGVDIIVIDNASDAFAADENSRLLVRRFIRKLARIAKASNSAVLLLVHIDKGAARHGANGQSYTGSVAWHNTSRSRLALVRDKGGNTELLHEKSNEGPVAAPRTLRWGEHGVPMPLLAADVERENDDDVEAAMRLVRAACACGVPVLCATTGAHTSWHSTRHLPEAQPFSDKSAQGPRRLHAALHALAGQRRIVSASMTSASRNVRDVWQLPDASAAYTQASHSATRPTPANGAADAASDACVSSPYNPHCTHARVRAGARVHASKKPKTH